MAGVKKVVQVLDSGVAVVADTYWHARRRSTRCRSSGSDREQQGLERLDRRVPETGPPPNRRSPITRPAMRLPPSRAPSTIEAVYSYPYLNHFFFNDTATTEIYTNNRCEVWCPTQNGEAALAAVSEECGLPIAQCEVHKMHLGGGFGRRGRIDYVKQAVAIAKQMPGTPIKLLWSREEDMTHCQYHPVTQCKLTAGIDAAGNVVGFHMRISGASISASLAPQNITGGFDPITFQGLLAAGPEGSAPNISSTDCDQPAARRQLLARRNVNRTRSTRNASSTSLPMSSSRTRSRSGSRCSSPSTPPSSRRWRRRRAGARRPRLASTAASPSSWAMATTWPPARRFR
jgi:isoquinoline 1-oxidoreductase beta subunit